MVGRPNVGKSTIFNALTGLRQHTGNWPGKTVELAQGWLRAPRQEPILVVDLPGTYALGAESDEGRDDPGRAGHRLGVDEAVARSYVRDQRPDLLVAVINSAALTQDLFLIGQLLTLPVPLLVVANMVDIVAAAGTQIDYSLLAQRLGVPVLPMTATRPGDVARLREAITATVAERRSAAGSTRETGRPGPTGAPPPPPAGAAPALIHNWVDSVLAGVVVHRPEAADGPRPAAEAVDRLLTHPWWGLIALFAVLGLAFAITFGLGVPLQSLLADGLVAPAGELIARLTAAVGAPGWLTDLAVDGVLAGAGTVLTFLPILALFFAVLAILEDSGYMARAAVVMDRFMHILGLHGKSFLPLFLGFGCNVPAVMGARTIESPRGRLMTIILAPLVPCAARLAVLNFLAAALFGRTAALVVWSMVALNLAAAVVLGLLLSRTLLPNRDGAELVMELPAYHWPRLGTIGYLLWHKLRSFLAKAGTVIVAASAILWAAGYLPTGDLETSYLAALGRALAPLGAVAGLDWRLLLAALASFVAKENALAALAVIYEVGGGGLADVLAAEVTMPAALSFMVLVMLFIPCVATVAVIHQELKSAVWTGFVLCLLFVLSFGAAAATFHLTSLFF